MKIDFSSQVWLAVAAKVQEEMDRLRKLNDAVALDPDLTNALRGEIRLCKRLLAWPEEANRAFGVTSD